MPASPEGPKRRRPRRDRPARGPRPAGAGLAGPRRQPLLLAAAILFVLLVLVLLISRGGGGSGTEAKAPPTPVVPGTTTALGRLSLAALRPDPEKDAAALTRSAAAGFANPLYRLVPGGAVRSAARVTALRPLIEKVAKDTDEDPDRLEAIVYLESAGRPAAMATNDVADASGLTQIVASTGTSLLGMKIDLARSRTLTRQIAKGGRLQARREAERRRVDPRFDPEQALRATTRYLDFARGELGGRDDLAVASYHMGVGNLQRALEAYGRGNVPYVELYFGTDPLTTPAASRILMSFADDSSSYLWRVGAAARIMRMSRDDPKALARENDLQNRKASPEDLLHPPGSGTFATPAALSAAQRSGAIVPLPTRALRANGIRIDRGMGELAPRLNQAKRLYRGLRPGAAGGLLAIGAATRALNDGSGSLIATSTVRDERYQSLLGAENIQATDALSQHTTGWAMDVSRNYAKGNQSLRFQWVLTRLQALDLIAWVREPTAIHLTFSSRATRTFGPVLRAALGR